MCCNKYLPAHHPWSWYPHHYPCAGQVAPHPHYHACCPVCCQPYHLCCCGAKQPVVAVQELACDTATPSKEGFIGGSQDVSLSIEYKPETGATSPALKITVTDSDGTSEWNLTSIPDGYHIKAGFASVTPGSTVKLEITECMARLRWCETVCC